MHGKKFLLQEFHYGSDGRNLFLRADFHPAAQQAMSHWKRASPYRRDGEQTSSVALRFDRGRAHATEMKLVAMATGDVRPVEVAFRKTLELRVSLDALGVSNGGSVRFQFSLWQGGLPMDAIPQQGWLELARGGTARSGRCKRAGEAPAPWVENLLLLRLLGVVWPLGLRLPARSAALPSSTREYLLSAASSGFASAGTGCLIASGVVIFRPYNSALSSWSGRSVAPERDTPANTPPLRDHVRISAVIGRVGFRLNRPSPPARPRPTRRRPA